MRKKLKSALSLLMAVIFCSVSLTSVSASAVKKPVISSPSFGDLNGDQEVNSIDLALLRSYIMGTEDLQFEVSLENSDLNMDKEINSIDLAILQKYILGMIQFLPKTQPTPKLTQFNVSVSEVFSIQQHEGGVVGQSYSCKIEDENIIELIDDKSFYTVPSSDMTIHVVSFEAKKAGETTVTFVSNNNINEDITYTIKVNP